MSLGKGSGAQVSRVHSCGVGVLRAPGFGT